MNRTKQSEYQEWSKRSSQARFNLAPSGLTSVGTNEFPWPADKFEITGPGGYGYAPLLQRIAQHERVPADCVVTAAGASMANHLAMAAVLEPGDDVVIEQPAYGPLLDVASYLGARVIRSPRREDAGFAVEPAELKKLMTNQTRLVVLTNLHNPTGALIPEEALRAIGEMAQQVGARVLVDEVYLGMLFDQRVPSAFTLGDKLSRGNDNPFVATNSLTKLYGLSGLRCGWIIASPNLAQRMWLLNDLFDVNAAHVAEQLSVVAFDQLEQFHERARSLLTANRALVNEFLDSRPDLECFRPPGGTVVFPRLTHGDPESFVRLLRDKYETSVVPGRFFEMPQHFRIGLGGETANVRGGLERLSAALDEFAPGRDGSPQPSGAKRL